MLILYKYCTFIVCLLKYYCIFAAPKRNYMRKKGRKFRRKITKNISFYKTIYD